LCWDARDNGTRTVSRRALVILSTFGLALAARLLILGFRSGDLESWEYETLAASIASGNGYVITRFGHAVLAFGDGNLYSFLAGALYASIGHQPLVLGVIQAVLASLAAPVLFVIAERPFGQMRAALGAGLAALHPGLLAYTLKLHPLGLDVLLVSLLVFWTLQRQWSPRGSAMAGLSLGLNLMSRPTYFVAGLGLLMLRWFTRRQDWRYLAAAAMVALAVGAPWVVRNWVLLGQPMLISTSFEDVWKGNNLAASGSSFVATGKTVLDIAPADLRQRLSESDELQANATFAQATLAFITQSPDQFAGLVVRKFLYFWWLPQTAGTLYPASWLTAYQVYAAIIFAFAAVGAVGIARSGTADERTLLTTILTLGLLLASLHALTYVEGRHRWGIEPLVLLVTARGVFAVASWLRPWLALLAPVTSSQRQIAQTDEGHEQRGVKDAQTEIDGPQASHAGSA
jgi:hypothetical protein